MHYVHHGNLQLAYREQGKGEPVLFLHEFAGSISVWDAQQNEFANEYRTIAYGCRGYPPSSMPDSGFSQDHAVDDLKILMDRLSVERAVLVGLSMGGTTVLNFAIRYPERVVGMVIASAGSGSDDKTAFAAEFAAFADLIESEGSASFAERYLRNPTRTQLLQKRPSVWAELRDRFAGVPAATLAGTIRGVMLRRPTVYELEQELRALNVPTLIMVGDEDNPVLRPAGFLAGCLPQSELVVLRRTGHTLNLEEPVAFNLHVRRFLKSLHRGRQSTENTPQTTIGRQHR